MSGRPSRTVEVILDAESAALLMARGSDFRLDAVKERFLEQLGPPITAELAARPGEKLLRLAARAVAGVIRLLRG